MAGVGVVGPGQNTMEYENWLKVAHGLFILRDAIAPVIDQEIKTFHQTLPGVVCGSCTYKDIAYDKKATFRWTNKKCVPCNSYLEKIAEQHNQYKEQLGPCWKNTDVACWSKFWEVGKCFLPRGHTKDECSASDTDCAGLLTMITNCRLLPKIFGRGADKVLAIRNTIFHAKAMSVDQSTTNQYFDTLIDYVDRMNVPDALKDNEKRKLKQLRDGHLRLPGEERMEIEIDAIKKRLDVLFEHFEDFSPKQVMIALEETSRFIKQREDLMVFFTDKLQRVEERITELSVRQTKNEHQLEGVVDKVDDLESQQNQTQSQLEGVGDKVADMEQLQCITQSQMKEMDSQMEGMEDRVTSIEQQHDISHKQLEGVKDKVKDIEQQLTLSMTSQSSETESSVKDTLSSNLGTCGSASGLTVSSDSSTSLNLKSDDPLDYLEKGVVDIDIQKPDEKFDAVLIYAEEDRDDALKLRDIICQFITFSDGSKPKICVLDRSDLPHIQSRFEHMDVATEKSNYMFLYMTKEGVKSEWFIIQKDESLMECIEIKNKQNCLIPLHTQPRSDYRYPYGTRSLKGIAIFQIVEGKTLSEVDPNTLTHKDLNSSCLEMIKRTFELKRLV